MSLILQVKICMKFHQNSTLNICQNTKCSLIDIGKNENKNKVNYKISVTISIQIKPGNIYMTQAF